MKKLSVMIEKFKEVLFDLLQNADITKGEGNMVVLNREQFKEFSQELVQAYDRQIPLREYMDSEMIKAVTKELHYLYNIPKSDDDNLVFLDLSIGSKEYPDGTVGLLMFDLDENGDVKPIPLVKLKP